MKTLLTNSYIKHFYLNRKKYREKRVSITSTVFLDEDGTVVASFINSHDNPSILEGRVYRLLCFRLLIGYEPVVIRDTQTAHQLQVWFLLPNVTHTDSC